MQDIKVILNFNTVMEIANKKKFENYRAQKFTQSNTEFNTTFWLT